MLGAQLLDRKEGIVPIAVHASAVLPISESTVRTYNHRLLRRRDSNDA
jgi:hypothetical protein